MITFVSDRSHVYITVAQNENARVKEVLPVHVVHLKIYEDVCQKIGFLYLTRNLLEYYTIIMLTLRKLTAHNIR